MHSQFDEFGAGTRHCEFIYTPSEYLSFGDAVISNPPLIHTSLKGLAASAWYLSVQARYVPTFGHTKLKYHFSDPDEKGNPFLMFKCWAKGNLIITEKLHPKSLVKELVTRDLTPNFSRHASFSLMPLEQRVEKITVKELPTLENEYDILVALNAQRRERLKTLKSRNSENSNSDVRALPLSA